MITKFHIRYWDQYSNGKVNRPREGVSGHAETLSAGDRNPQVICDRLHGSRAQKRNLAIHFELSTPNGDCYRTRALEKPVLKRENELSGDIEEGGYKSRRL